MRIVITKLCEERGSSCRDVLKDDLANMDGDGISRRAEFRMIDLRPFGFAGFGTVDISEETYKTLEPGTIYELTITPVE